MSAYYDLSNFNYDNADAPSRLDPGWYIAEVTDATPEETGTVNFTFRVLRPSHWANAEITDKLFHPANSIDESKARISAKRVALFGKRLGVIPREAFGQAGVELDWTKAVGKVVAIKVDRRKYTDKEGIEREASNLAFDGVYDPTDKKVPDEIRLVNPERGGSGAGAGAGGGQNPRQGNIDYSGI